MNEKMVLKLIYSVVILVVIHLIFHVFKRIAKKTQETRGIRQSRYFAIRRMLSISSFTLGLLVMMLIWNLNPKNIWVSATSILALIAIAFFAVWSLVGNILAGLIIYFTSPFKIDDSIEVMPDEIRGTVLAINSFYTVLLTEDKNYINIPNSLFFQKYIQVKRAHNPGQEALPPS